MLSSRWVYIVLVYLAAMNVVAFFLYGIDKYKAKHAKRRISEATLIWLSLLGGSIGAWLGMKLWHHKTQHNKLHKSEIILLISTKLLRRNRNI